MDERTMLELAARAAGIPRTVVGAAPASYWIEDSRTLHQHWNPLTDDGDALRLAVTLGLQVDIGAIDGDTTVIPGGVFEKHGSYPCAATRRAIVRAAAAIGEKIPIKP